MPSHLSRLGFVDDLASHGGTVALAGAAGALSYGELSSRVDRVVEQLAGPRRLARAVGANTVDALVAYLAALRAGHAVLLCSAGAADELDRRYDPDIVISGDGQVRVVRLEPAHALHPELALLLSTSGSTGSAKLVRLSYQNLQANAESIAQFLDITAEDRAATSLPMFYSYGLSVIHSHLLRGASLLLTEHSVTDPRFWTLMREQGATSFAGVPHTFDLLDRIGFDASRLPRLRYVTQAGGRLAPDRVRHYAAMGREQGWRLFVMYGQTEATARIAYLPPDLAEQHPDCVGIAIPGGHLRVEPVDGADDPQAGELVYSGPNVMLGYAERPADLAEGRSGDELRTGDLARLTSAGLYQIVGRRNRFLKLLGLRIDLQRVEDLLAEQGLTGHCAGDDTRLVVAVLDQPAAARPDAELVRRGIAAACGLPPQAIDVHVVAGFPQLETGKIDYGAVRRLGAGGAAVGGRRVPSRATDVASMYAEVLGRDDVTPLSTFAQLGGDSLSYVEVSVRLAQTLRALPAQWPTTPVGELQAAADAAAATTGSRPVPRVETSVVLRALAMVLIVGTHALLFTLQGGAHILLAVSGFNFGRFHVTDVGRRRRAGRIAATVARIAIPTSLLCALLWATGDLFDWTNVIFVSHFVESGAQLTWALWFIDAIIYMMLGAMILLCTPWGDGLARRYPLGLPLALLGVGLALRYDLVPRLPWSHDLLGGSLWLFALGWALAKASGTWHRALLTAVVVATVHGYFGDVGREVLVVAGIVLLIWLPALPSANIASRVVAVVAQASLFVYVVHFQLLHWTAEYVWPRTPPVLVYPLLTAAVLASFGLGIGLAELARRAEARLVATWRRRARRSEPGRVPQPDRRQVPASDSAVL